MNNFKNISNKKKSFFKTLIDEFMEVIVIISIILYFVIFITLGNTGIFDFLGYPNKITNGLHAAVYFPIVLFIIAVIIWIMGFIPLGIHKIKAVYNYTYLPLTTDEIKDALDKNIISSKEDYIKLLIDSLRYGATNKPSSFFDHFNYIKFSRDELYSLCKAFEEVFDSPIVINYDMISYMNKYTYKYTPFDNALNIDNNKLDFIRNRPGNNNATFALYINGYKYMNILENIDITLCVCR